MTESIIVALITGVLSLMGVFFANRKGQALMEYKIDELTDKVDKHNNMIERVYALEKRAAVIEEKQSVANHRIDDLEHRPGA